MISRRGRMSDECQKSQGQQSVAFQAVLQSEAVPVHTAECLTKGGQMAHIRLNEMVYVLRITRAGKLILTK